MLGKNQYIQGNCLASSLQLAVHAPVVPEDSILGQPKQAHTNLYQLPDRTHSLQIGRTDRRTYLELVEDMLRGIAESERKLAT